MFAEIALQGIQIMSDEEAQEHFDNFFEDVFIELEDKYGEIEEMNVCDNLGDHLVGNVYVKVCLLLCVSQLFSHYFILCIEMNAIFI